MRQEYKYKIDYDKMTDKQIVEMILSIPHNEEAAAYLLYTRYHILLQKIYNNLTSDDSYLDDCVQDLFFHFRGNDNSWHNLATFEWRSTFGYWLKGVVWNEFRRILLRLIENKGRKTSIDNNNPDKPTLQISGENGEETIEQRERKVLVMEAIGQLIDEDQRFIILKRLQGYTLDAFYEAWNDSSNYLVTISNHSQYEPQPLDLSDVKLERELIELREAIAENAHEIWANERKKEGWTYGPKRNDEKKLHPDMIPYHLLPESEKKDYRQMAIETMKLIKKLGWELIKRK